MLKLTRWTIAHRRIVVLSWIVLAVGVLAVSQAVGKRNANNFSLPNTDSQRAANLLQGRFPTQAGDADQIVFRARTGKLTDASTRAAIAPVLVRIARFPHVAGVMSPYEAGANAVSKTGTIGFATVEFDQRANELPKAAIDRVINTAETMRSPTLQVELGGQAIKQAQQTSIGFATGVGLIAAIVVLLLSFGSLLAMGLPIVTALFGLGAGLGVIGLGSHLVDMVDFSSELALMIGLGVGIDYALFIVTRYRDAYRQNGGDVQPALELAMNTAGRAILFAGATVVIALLGMFALGVSFLYGAAIAASLGVLLVLAASLTLLPALLMFTGKRIGRARRGSRPREARAGFWLHWVGLIQRRPAWAALGSTVLLLALASPALGLRLGTSDSGNDPTKQTTRHAYDLLAAGFGSGFNGPLQLAVRLPSAGDTAGLTRLTTALRHTRGIASVATPRLNVARGWLAGLIGVQPGPIDAFIPVMVFAIVFGLSMDYEVFLVSRIHEEWQHRGDASTAVREGLANTGRVITAAAAVMVAVFASFAAGDDRVLKLFGVAMATAVFLDAIVIRSILMPAVLELFGNRTWAFPKWFDRRLPRLAIEPVTPPTPVMDEAA